MTGRYCRIGLENSRHPLNQSDTKLKPNRDLVTRVFPRLRPFKSVYFEFLLPPCNNLPSSYWPL